MITPVILNCPSATQPNVSCRQGSTTLTGFSTGSCYSSVLGAADGTNINCSEYSTIVMGRQNDIKPISGGGTPILGCYNTVLNGLRNTLSGYYNSILGGSGNLIDQCDCQSTRYNIIATGCKNTICNNTASAYNTISGGYCHTINSFAATISGGNKNCATGGGAVIGGGTENFAGGQNSGVLSGSTNCALNITSVIAGGWKNFICGDISTMSGGYCNNIGYLTPVCGGPSCLAFLGGGCYNAINPFTNSSYPFASDIGNVVSGGGCNAICSFDFNTISGGYLNTISGYRPIVHTCIGHYNAIGGGCSNFVAGCSNVVAGGGHNCINSLTSGALQFNAILGGCSNYITGNDAGYFNGTVSGYCNYMLTARASFIGGGAMNCITVGGGELTFNAIGGGNFNTICGNYSGVLGGQCNTVSGNYSSVLGGQCVTISNNWASASGYNLASTFDCAFHANQIVAPNTKPYSTGGASLMQYFAIPSSLASAYGLPASACFVLM